MSQSKYIQHATGQITRKTDGALVEQMADGGLIYGEDGALIRIVDDAGSVEVLAQETILQGE